MPLESYSPGKVNFTATAEALQSQELCGNEMPQVPELGQKDTVIKPLLVEVCGLIFLSLRGLIMYCGTISYDSVISFPRI